MSKSISHKRSGSKPDNSVTFDPWVLWVTFRRCWPWALPVGAVLAGVTAFYVLQSFVPKYRAMHLLEANRDYLIYDNVMPTIDDLAATERALFYNPLILDRVLEDPDVIKAPSLSEPETAEQNLIRNLSISSGGTRSRLEVSYTDSDREAAAKVCNAIVESYLDRRDAFDEKRVSNLEKWLEPEILNWEKIVSDHRDRVQTLSKLTMGYAPDQEIAQNENQQNLALVTRLRYEMADLGLEISISQARLALHAEENKNQPNNSASEPIGSGDEAQEIPPTVLVERIAPTELQIEQFARQDRDVLDAEQQIKHYLSLIQNIQDSDKKGIRRDDYERFRQKEEKWRAWLTQVEITARKTAKEKLEKLADEDYNRRLAAAEMNAKQLHFQREQEQSEAWKQEQQQVEELKSRLEIVEAQYEEERLRLEQYGGATAQLQFARDELAVASGVLNKLRGRVAAIRTERRQDGAVRSMAPATPPKTPVEKVPYKKLVLFGGMAMLIPFALGLLWEIRTQRLTDSNMCDKNGLSVIGEIARLPVGPRSNKGRRMFEESIDTLRASLFLSLDTQNSRSIAVVSSMSGEGKSSVSSQLALSIAKATGKTVLLVDADLRCPDQHDIFGLEMGKGFSGVLSGEATLSETVDASLGDLIHVLPAGPLSSSPHRLITPQHVRAFVNTALEEYAFIVFDTAPVLSAGETLAVASAVDSTLLCVMRDISRMDNVTRTTRRLEAVGATVAGTVFSGVSASDYAYRYGDYRYATTAQGSIGGAS